MENSPGHRRPTAARRLAVTGAAVLTAAAIMAAYAPSFAYAEGAPQDGLTATVEMPEELTDFRACPALPAGVDPAAWRCELHLATPRLKFGNVDIPALAPIVMTHAEGRLPNAVRTSSRAGSA